MKSIVTKLAVVIAFALVGQMNNASAQSVYLLKQNFDSIKVLHKDTLPHGWTMTMNITAPHTVGASMGWFTDTLRTNSAPSMAYGTAPDTASGLDHVVIRNNLDSTGTFELHAPWFSTMGKTNIGVSWGSRTTASFTTPGSTTATLYFSVDNGANWDSVAYTRVVADGAWHATNNGSPIMLPTKAENKAKVMLKWSCNIVNSSNGTLRLDDIIVKSGATPLPKGIATVNMNNAFSIVPNPAVNYFTINCNELNTANSTIAISNLLGQTVKTIAATQFPITIEKGNLQSGLYLMQVINAQSKVVATKKLVIE